MFRGDGSILDKFKILKAIGFDGVEVNSPSNFDRDEIRDAIKQTGLVVPGVIDSIHWKKRLSSNDPALRAEGVAGLETAIKDSAYFGGSMALLVPGKVILGEANYAQCWERSVLEIKKVIPLAEKHNIKIAFENVWNDFIVRPEEALRFVEEFDHPLIGWFFDVGNIVRYNDPVDWFEVLPLEKIFRLDIKGFNLNTRTFAKIGEGAVDWSAVMAASDACGYSYRNDAWASAEVKGGGEARMREVYENLTAALGA